MTVENSEIIEVLVAAEKSLVAFYRSIMPFNKIDEPNPFAEKDETVMAIRNLLNKLSE